MIKIDKFAKLSDIIKQKGTLENNTYVIHAEDHNEMYDIRLIEGKEIIFSSSSEKYILAENNKAYEIRDDKKVPAQATFIYTAILLAIQGREGTLEELGRNTKELKQEKAEIEELDGYIKTRMTSGVKKIIAAIVIVVIIYAVLNH